MYPPAVFFSFASFQNYILVNFYPISLKIGNVTSFEMLFFSYRVSATCNSNLVEGSMKLYLVNLLFTTEIFLLQERANLFQYFFLWYRLILNMLALILKRSVYLI